MKKRLFSLLLAAALCLETLPAAALAAENSGSEAPNTPTETVTPDAVPPSAEEEQPEGEEPPLRQEPAPALPEAGEAGVPAQPREESASGEESSAPVQPEILMRPFDEAASSDLVLFLPGVYDAYAWEMFRDGRWSPCGAEAELRLTKQQAVECGFRCTVTLGETALVSQDFALYPEALDGFGPSLLASSSPLGHSDFIEFYARSSWRGPRFDIRGVENGGFQTTFWDGGYGTLAEVDGAQVQVPYADNSGSATPIGGSLAAGIKLELAYGDRYAKVIYSVTNNGSTEKTFKIGSHADVMIHNNDRAQVERTSNGLSMDGAPVNPYKFQLVAPTCDTLWYGFYAYADDNVFDNLPSGSGPYNGDSGMSWSWAGTVKPGETWERHVLIGAGELPQPPAAPSFAAGSLGSVEPGATLEIQGTTENVADGSTVYVSFAGQETTAEVTGNSFTASLPVPAGQEDGAAPLTAWVVTPDGGLSPTVTTQVTIASAPVMKLTTDSITLLEDDPAGLPNWSSFVDTSATVGSVSRQFDREPQLSVPGTYTATYTAENGGKTASAELAVTIQARPIKLDPAKLVTGDSAFDLSSKLLYPGPDPAANLAETGFVYGPTQNPAVGMSGCTPVQTAPKVTAKNGALRASIAKSSLIPGLGYYARPYVKTAAGKFIYGPQTSYFYIPADGYGTFIVAPAEGPGQFTVTWTGSMGSHSVQYRTVNGSAVAGTHFTHTSGTLNFDVNNNTRTVTVPESSAAAPYNGNAATAYSNTNRSYFLELYRPKGGAVIAEGKARAEKEMAVPADHLIDRDYYANFHQAKVGDGVNETYHTLELGWKHEASINWKKTRWDGMESDVTLAGTLNERQDEWREVYYTNTAQAIQFQFCAESVTGNDGTHLIKFHNKAGSAEMAFTGSTSNLLLPKMSTATCSGKLQLESLNGDDYLVLKGTTKPSGDGMSLEYSARDGSDNSWSATKFSMYLRPGDYVEPQAIGIAPMQNGVTYLPGEQVTVSVIFNEIVDSVDASLVKLNTNWGTLNYGGGAGTNVLYFTGTVGKGHEGTALSVTGIEGLSFIKDMSPNGGTTATGTTGDTSAQIPATPAPTVTVGSITNSNGKLTAKITGTNYLDGGKLEYAWTNSADIPAVGWLPVPADGWVSTRQMTGTWYLHGRAVNKDGSTVFGQAGPVALGDGTGESKPVLPELTATANNTNWAQSRDISLSRSPADAQVTVTGPGVSGATVSGSKWTATENGTYTFTLTTGSDTVEQSVPVSRIDTQAPTAALSSLANDKTYLEAVTLTVTASDTGSGISTVTGVWSNNGAAGEPQTATLQNGVCTFTSPSENGSWSLKVTVTDRVGNNSETIPSPAYTINRNEPTVTVGTQVEKTPQGWTYTYEIDKNSTEIVSIQLPDGRYLTEAGEIEAALSGSVKLTAAGTYCITVTDSAGHVVRSSPMVVTQEETQQPIDGIAPAVRLLADPTWTRGHVEVTVSVYDEGYTGGATWEVELTGEGIPSGEKLTLTRNAQTPGAYTGTFTATENGSYNVSATDTAGNVGTIPQEEPFTVSCIDRTAPSFTVSGNPAQPQFDSATLTIAAQDAQSGLDAAPYSFDGGKTWTDQPSETFTANQAVEIWVKDKVGNVSKEKAEIQFIRYNVSNTANDGAITYARQGYDVSRLFTLDPNAGTPSYSLLTEGTTGKAAFADDGKTLLFEQAGDFKVQLVTGPKGDYVSGEPVVATLTVRKAAPTAADFTVTIPAGGIYDGQARTATAAAKASGLGAFSVLYVPQSGSAADAAPKDAGTYTVKLQLEEGKLFTGSDGLEIGSFTVAPRPVKLDWTHTYTDSIPYDGKEHTVSARVSNLVEGDNLTLQYSGITAATDVGSYTASATLDGAAKANYTLEGGENTSLSWSIGKAAVSFTVTDDQHIYDGAAKTATVAQAADEPVQIGAEGYTVTYGGRENQTDAGEYDILVELKDENFCFKDNAPEVRSLKVGQLNIDKKEISVLWKDTLKTYNGEEQSPTASLLGVLNGDQVTVTAGTGKAAETKQVTAALSGSDANNYTLTNPTADFTIQKAPVAFIAATTQVKHDGQPHTAGVVPQGAEGFTRFTVAYYNAKGEPVASPTEEGAYDIRVRLTDDNFRHAAGTDGAERSIGTFHIYRDAPLPQYTVSFAGGEGAVTGSTAALAETTAETVRTLPESGFTRAGYRFMGWQYAGRCYQPGEALVQPAANVTMTALWSQPTFSINGIVNQDGGPVEGAVVTLTLGSRQLYETSTDAEGKYRFVQLVPGLYNLRVSYAGIVQTVQADITGQDVTVAVIDLPLGKTNSVVEVTEGTPAIVVGKLEETFTEKDLYTEEDKSVVAAGGEVEFKFTAKKQAQSEENTQQQEILGKAPDVGLFLDLTVTKTVTTPEQTVERKPVTDSKVLYEATIWLPAALQNMYSYSVYRWHDDQVQSLSTAPNEDGEYFQVLTGENKLVLHVRKFSTYAIGFTRSAPSFGSGGSSQRYTPTVEQPEHGTVTVTPDSPKANEKVTITVHPQEGYMADTVVVTGPKGQTVPVSRNPDGTYSFRQPKGEARISVTFRPYLADPETTGVAALLNIDGKEPYLRGYADGTFAPDRRMTRAQVAQMFYNLLLEKDVPVTSRFADVPQGAWCEKAIATLQALGIMKGVTETRFAPDRPITRAEFAVVAMRFAQLPEDTAVRFTDVEEDDWFCRQVAGAVHYGWIKGYADGSFRPDRFITRAQAAAIVNRMLGRTGEPEERPEMTFSDVPASHWAYDEICLAAGKRP